MASYQNTSEYYCDITTETCPDHYTDQNMQVNHSLSGSQIQSYFPTAFQETNIFAPTEGQIIIYANGQYYENTPPYNVIQCNPLTPEPVSYPVFQLEPTPRYDNQYMARRHRGQILPSSKGNFKAVVKRKRKRTIFTTEQVEALEDIFKTKQYISREERQVIVNQLQLNDKAVKIWFQNRRLKTKKMQDSLEEQAESSYTEHLEEEKKSSVIVCLDSVESQISKKTDENGFVTLDDGVMGDLVNVIDEFLTKKCIDVPVEEIVESHSSPVYEPISPASNSDSTEEYTEDSSVYWRPSIPNESLQRLFDLQTMLSL